MLGQFIPQPIGIPIPPLRATLVAAANVLGRTGLNSKEMFDTMTLENIRRRLEEAISGDLPDVQAISALFLEDGVIGTIAASGDPALIGNAAQVAGILAYSRTGPDVRDALLSIDAMRTVAREGNPRQIQCLALASEGVPEARRSEVTTYLFTSRALETLRESGDVQALAAAAISFTRLPREDFPGLVRGLLTDDNLALLAASGASESIGLASVACQLLPAVEARQSLEILLTPAAVSTVANQTLRAEVIGWVANAALQLPHARKVNALITLLQGQSLETLDRLGNAEDFALVAGAAAECGHAPLVALAAEFACGMRGDPRAVEMERLITDDSMAVVAKSGTARQVGAMARAVSLHLSPEEAQAALGPLLTPETLRRVASSQDSIAISWVAEATRHLPGAERAEALDRLLDEGALTTLVNTGHPVVVSRVVQAAAGSGHARVLGRTALAMSALTLPDQRESMLRLLLTEQNLGLLAASKDASVIGSAATAVSRMTGAQRCRAFDRLLTEDALSAVVENADPVPVARVERAVADQGSPGVIGRTAMSFSRLPDHAQRETALSGLLTPKVMRAMRDTGDDQSIRDVLRAADTVPAVRRAVLTGPLLDDMPLWRKGFFNLIPGRAPSATASPAARAKTPTGLGLG